MLYNLGMANRKKIEAKDLGGLFIYQDPKKGCVYYDIFTKKGYIITNSEVKTYNIYSLSLPIGIMAAYVLTILGFEFWTSALVGLAVYVILKLIFRFKFLYSLPEIPNYQKGKRENVFVTLIKKYGTAKLLILSILFVAIVIVTLINAKVSNFEGLNLYLNYGIAAIVSVVSIIFIIALLKSIGEK